MDEELFVKEIANKWTDGQTDSVCHTINLLERLQLFAMLNEHPVQWLTSKRGAEKERQDLSSIYKSPASLHDSFF